MTDLGILHQILDALRDLQQGQKDLQQGQAELCAEMNERFNGIDKHLEKLELYQTSTIDHQAQDYAQIQILNEKVANLVHITEAHGEKLKTL